MGVSVFTRDTKVLGPITSNSGGVATFNVDCGATDQVYRIMGRAYAVAASASHLSAAGSWCCEYVVVNKNAVLTALTAVASSANPDNFSGLIASRVEAADSAYNTTTGAWTISGTNAVLTVTVQSGAGSVAGVSVFLVADIESCGAT